MTLASPELLCLGTKERDRLPASEDTASACLAISLPPAGKQSWLRPGSDSLARVQLPLPFWISCMPIPLDALEFWKGK